MLAILEYRGFLSLFNLAVAVTKIISSVKQEVLEPIKMMNKRYPNFFFSIFLSCGPYLQAYLEGLHTTFSAEDEASPGKTDLSFLSGNRRRTLFSRRLPKEIYTQPLLQKICSNSFTLRFLFFAQGN